MTLFDYLKNIFIFLIFLQLAPSLIQNIKKQYSKLIMPSTRVGVIKLHGQLTHSSWYAKQLHTFFKDNDIKAIVLKIESSGGAAGTGQALSNEILTLKKEYPKPIITLTENMCASGAYYIASATDHIIASGQAVIGSIGSYMPYLFQLQDFIEQYHIGYEAVKAGTYKGMTDPFIPMTNEDRAQLQSVVNDSYEQFIADIAHNRKLPIQTASEWAEGKLFTGKQGFDIGLIDELGSAHQAIAYIKNKKLIDGDIEWVHPQARGGFLQRIIGQDDTDEAGSLFSNVLHSFSLLRQGLQLYTSLIFQKKLLSTSSDVG